MKFKLIFFLTTVLIKLSNEYSLSRLNHRFDSKQMVNGRKIAKEGEEVDPILLELRKLEQKLTNKRAAFTGKDLISLLRLIKHLNELKSVVETPNVYWYSRMGR